MLVPKILLNDDTNLSEVKVQLATLAPHSISVANWTNSDHYPEVSFRIAHNGENIFLQFEVKENEVRAMAKGNHSQVFKDSCVEFFISFGKSDYYYNLEQSCIGEMLFGYRNERKNATYASDDVMKSIRREASLGSENFELKKGNFHWTLTSMLPLSCFWGEKLETFGGVKARANFYKCGDELSLPHYLSWMPVCIDKPNFHRVDFFGELEFES